MKKKLILLLFALTLISFNTIKVNAETLKWKAIKLYGSDKNVYRKYTNAEGKVVTEKNIAYVYIEDDTIFCIEMGKDISSDITSGKATTKYISTLDKYFTKNTDKKVKLGNQEINILDAVSLISLYGASYYKSHKEINSITHMNNYYLAAQTMIWKILADTGVYGDPIKSEIEVVYKENNKEIPIDLTKYKNNIIKKINKFYQKPNIQSNVEAKLTTDNTRYEFTVIDDGNVLKYFTTTTSTEGVTCNQNNNSITCSYPANGPTPTSIELVFTKELKTTNDKVFKVGDNYQATLLTDKSPKLTYTKTINLGANKHKLSIIKVDAEDSKKILEGVTYQICKDADCKEPFDTQITNENGIATFNDLDAGVDYYVKEIETIDEYVLDSTTKQIKIDLTNTEKYNQTELTYKETYSNTKEKINGYIQIIKVDKEDKKPLEGIIFDIYDENDKVIETIKTDKDGKAKTKLLPKGIYYAKEKETLKDYILSEEEQVIKIEENNKVYDLTFVNEKNPQTADINIILIITIASCSLICAIIMYIKKINLVKNTI